MPADRHVFALDLAMERQPDDSTCGPTCLNAVYRYYGHGLALDTLIEQVPSLPTGGTLAVNLANHALRRGYRATIFTYNLSLFDPSWFTRPAVDLAERLRAQAAAKHDPRIAEATGAYLDFLELGGRLAMEDLTASLLRRFLEQDQPILTGLSATFLYRSPREIGERVLHDDDLRGFPTGHFVVLCGWDGDERAIRVADPYEKNPRFPEQVYWEPVQRVINAILLGVLTYDANLLLLEPGDGAA